MKKEDLIALGLEEELAVKVAEASAEELKGFIPKARFDELNETKKALEKDIAARDKQLEDLKKVDAEGLKAEIDRLQGENQTAKEKYEADLKQMRIESEVEKALLNAKAKNLKAVKALLDIGKLELDGESLKGLDDQIKTLLEDESTKFLFGEGEASLKGLKPGEAGGKPDSGKNPWSKEHWNLTEQGKLLRENPELAQRLKSAK